MRDDLPDVINTPEIRFPCSEERKFAAVADVKAALVSGNGVEVNDVDGVRVASKDGWWLLRASNTQDVLVARCESKTQDGLDRLKAQLRAAIDGAGIAAPGDF